MFSSVDVNSIKNFLLCCQCIKQNHNKDNNNNNNDNKDKIKEQEMDMKCILPLYQNYWKIEQAKNNKEFDIIINILMEDNLLKSNNGNKSVTENNNNKEGEHMSWYFRKHLETDNSIDINFKYIITILNNHK